MSNKASSRTIRPLTLTPGHGHSPSTVNTPPIQGVKGSFHLTPHCHTTTAIQQQPLLASLKYRSASSSTAQARNAPRAGQGSHVHGFAHVTSSPNLGVLRGRNPPLPSVGGASNHDLSPALQSRRASEEPLGRYHKLTRLEAGVTPDIPIQRVHSSLLPAPRPAASGAPSYEAHVLCSTGTSVDRPILLQAGAGSLQGKRTTMEDVHIIHLVQPVQSAAIPKPLLGLCLILDGHCGRNIAEFAARVFPEKVFSHPELGQDNVRVLIESLITTDRLAYKSLKTDDSGATHIASLVHKNMLFVIGLGDARAVLCEHGTAVAVIQMSRDHKASDASERRRIHRAGGMVQFDRVGGCLAVSRALGDWDFKLPAGALYPDDPKDFTVSSVGEVFQINITDATEFLILACDGIWDVLSNEEAVAFVRNQLLRRQKACNGTVTASMLNEIAHLLAQHAIDCDSNDNVSVIIQTFH